MRVSRRVLRSFLRADPVAREPAINLVPMIDILTVLVLYLLVGSIASHLAILQLKLPAPDTAPPPDQPPLALHVVVRKTVLEVADRTGMLKQFPATAEGHDLDGLSSFLGEIKERASRETAITLLVEPDVPYDTLVQVMDAVRVLPHGAVGPNASREMFPGISIGDAPDNGAVDPAATAQPATPAGPSP
jgi:biopolymer transport protein ExbD